MTKRATTPPSEPEDIRPLPLALTTQGPARRQSGGRIVRPVNTCRGGVSCTLNTRYDGLSETTDIVTLAHFPKTVVLIEYD